MSCGKRRDPSPRTVLELYRFYDARTCVATGQRGTFHHLNGVPCRSKFEHLIPLVHELHQRLVPKARGGTKEADIPDELKNRELRDRARRHYRKGKALRAFGCARLAHSLHRHFIHGEVDTELSSAGEALHYLRRSIGLHSDLGYRALAYILKEEIIPALSQLPALSFRTTFLLSRELSSWLNEQGHSQIASLILHKLVTEKRRANFLTREEESGLQRQWAHAVILSGGKPHQIDRALGKAGAEDDSKHNLYGMLNTKLLMLLNGEDYGSALHMAQQGLEEFGRDTHGSYDHPERVGISYETFLGFLGLSLVVRAHDRGYCSWESDFEVLEGVERERGRQAKMILSPRVVDAAREVSTTNPLFGRFLHQRTVPQMPEGVANDIQKAIESLWW